MEFQVWIHLVTHAGMDDCLIFKIALLSVCSAGGFPLRPLTDIATCLAFALLATHLQIARQQQRNSIRCISTHLDQGTLASDTAFLCHLH